MRSGDIITADFRPQARKNGQEGRPLRIIQWNIERGYELEKIIDELREVDADVLGLQEIDIGCDRSDCKDTGTEIAKALQLNYAFVCEFEELRSPLRDARSQGGGFHGNAILSKFDITNPRAIEHRCHPVDWENPAHKLAQKEPRKGRRFSLAVDIATPQGPLVCYSCHLEVFCGMLARIAQFADILKDARTQISQGKQHQAILGDLNTMGHGIARFSPNFCTDKMRFRNLWQTEAQFWHNNIFLQRDAQYWPVGEHRETEDAQATNLELQKWSLPEDVCKDALNPGFEDPFHPLTITLDNEAYRWLGVSLMCGKLDWLLLRKCTVVSKDIGNHNYAASDHKWLSADVNLL